MEFKDIRNKLTWKDVAVGLALAVTTGVCTNGYLKLEDYVAQKMFCNNHEHLKGESIEVLEQHAVAYWPDIHSSNRERYFGAFVGWVEKCE